MKYEKPEVTLVSTATAAIQSLGKQISPNPDSSRTKLTVGAYEADE
jgi:hypothetical protein